MGSHHPWQWENFPISSADEKVSYGAVAKVMAQIQNAGVGKFTFVMLPEMNPQHP
ncbi:MAG: hypothetical protein U1E63_06775 [Burkholderiales bacterium]